MAILQPTFHCTHTCLFHWFPVSSPSRYRLANIQKASQKNFVVSHLDFVSSDYQQVRQPVPTDEVEFMRIRSLNTPVQGRAPASASRMSTPKAEELISAAMRRQQLCNRTPIPL